jgi:hypothetical protein
MLWLRLLQRRLYPAAVMVEVIAGEEDNNLNTILHQ